MQGIQFVIDEKGDKTAVLIDLKKYGDIWEDIYDRLLAQSRTDDPRDSIESVREKLQQLGKLNG
jgi:hypothetical protein